MNRPKKKLWDKKQSLVDFPQDSVRDVDNQLFVCFFNRNSTSNSCTYHWVVTHTDQTHHFIVSWNGSNPKYDIREWNAEHQQMTRGVTMTRDELEQLAELISAEIGAA